MNYFTGKPKGLLVNRQVTKGRKALLVAGLKKENR